MRRLLSFLLLATLVAGGEALAQIDPDPDGIGIYADQAATVNAVTATPNVPLEAYLVLTRPSLAPAYPAIGSWEAMIGVPGNAMVWGWNIPGSYWLNVGSPPNFQVAYGRTALPATNAVLLMTLIVMVTDSEPALFYVRGATYDSHQDGLPCYIALEAVEPIPGQQLRGMSEITPLHPYPDGPDQPSFKINPGRTPVEAATWGQVKALY